MRYTRPFLGINFFRMPQFRDLKRGINKNIISFIPHGATGVFIEAAEWQGNISNLRPGTYLIRVVNNRTGKLVGENKFVKL